MNEFKIDPTIQTKGRKGKNEMTEENKKRLNYLTQYANDMTDEQFFDRIDNRAAEYDLELDLFIEIAELMPNISDAINEELFNEMLEATSNADLEIIINILRAVDDADLYELDKLTDYRLERMMNENMIHDESYFNEMADWDLRENGIDASCLSWINEMPSSFEYAELDLYDRFTTMTAAEVIEKFFDEYY